MMMKLMKKIINLNEEKHKTKESTLSNNNENNYDNCDDAVQYLLLTMIGRSPYVPTPTETEIQIIKKHIILFKLR